MRRRNTAPSVSFFAFQDIITSITGIFILIVLCLVLELVEKRSDSSVASERVSAETLESMTQEVHKLQDEYARQRQSMLESADNNQWNREQQLQLFANTSANADQQLARIESLTSSTQASIQVAKLEQQGLAKQYQAAGAKRDELKRLGAQTLALEVQIAELQSEDLIVFRDQTADGRQLVLVEVGVNSIAVSDALSGGQERFQGTTCRRDFEKWLAKKQLGVRQFLIVIRPGAASQFEVVRKSLDATSAAYGFDVIASEKKVRLASQGIAP